MLQTLSIAYGLLLSASAAQALVLGSTAQAFGVCASSTVTNVGSTVINGKLGLTPGTSTPGFPPGTATAIEINTPSATACHNQAAAAYGSCLAAITTTDLTGTTLGGLTLGPGVYNFNGGANLNGILHLDAANNPAAQFIFKIATTLVTSASSQVVLQRGAKACNVFWCVGSSATIGGTNIFKGTLIAYTSIGVGSSTSDVGGFFALNGAVTLDNDTISKPGAC